MQFGELMEVILYVEDMQKQVAYYRDVLNFDVSYPAGLVDYSDQPWVTLQTGACTLALHGGGQRRFGSDAPKIVFQVEDVEAARQYLIDSGITMGEVRSAAPGVTVCDGTDPEGNQFSIEYHN